MLVQGPVLEQGPQVLGECMGRQVHTEQQQGRGPARAVLWSAT